ncbi:nicotinate phosphoribosyltransferase [Candidatus Saccharibacteria bacterium TM7i]|nr:nicotinate phosphoribosyltransferase [Candidatus Saccharibacteria bacterium TM7i]
MEQEQTTLLTQGLDYYKATMSQLEFEKHRHATVSFELKNRGANLLSEYVTPAALHERLDTFQQGWQPEEVAYLAGLQNQDGKAQFTEAYLDHLIESALPPINIHLDANGDIAAKTTGEWPLVTFWETVVMSELNELYFENKLAAEGSSLQVLYEEGDGRLDEKISTLKERPDIKFADFGTRRRFSYGWQKHVVERVANELPDNFIGTSNIYLAHTLGVPPIGTYAHELPMVYAALTDKEKRNPLEGHSEMLRDWEEVYRGDLSIALTDTFTSDFFFRDFALDQARKWDGLRHDSGDPSEFGEQVIAFYESRDINPIEKTIVFSDGLDLPTIIELADYFKGRINVVFGWGTTLTNDLGVKANNIVMKAVEVNGTKTVKLSDDEGKHTGPVEKISRYESRVTERLGSLVLNGVRGA